MTSRNNIPSSSIEKSASSTGKTKRLRALGHLARDERGMSTVEYVILLVVIVAGAVGIWTEIGGKITSELGAARTEINTLKQSNSSK